MKIWLDIVMVIAVAISISISIKSCQISDNAETTSQNAVNIAKESNKIAKDALDSSQYQFIQVNRPYLIVGPSKYENGEYWDITLKSNVVEIIIKYKIKNVGNVAAKDIEIPDKIVLRLRTPKNNKVPFSFKKEIGKIALGPGDTYVCEINFELGYESDDKAKKYYDYQKSNRSEGVTFKISVEYSNELDESQQYRTVMLNEIHNDTAKIIKSEMIVINKELK